MTAIRTGFYMNPEYQKALAKLNREERSVLGSLLIDTNAAEAEMKRYLTFAELGSKQKATEKRLELKESEIGKKYELGKEQLASYGALKEKEIAQDLTLGREKMTTAKDISMSRMGSKYGLEQQAIDYEKSQYPWTLGLGIADVAAGGLLGYGKMKRDIQDSEKLRRINLDIYGRR